ncbi:MAG TPA: hypothetical protein VHC48_14760, partial [Puia sp.]|nr:hypothetical protein [Puia sp.]
MIGLNSVGTPAYGDYMIKTTTEINKNNKLSFIAMFNPESFTRDPDDFSKSPSLNKDNSSNFIGRSKTSKAVLGLNLRTLTGRKSYLRNVLYYRNKHVDNNLGVAWPTVDAGGNIIKKENIPYEDDLRHIKDDQQELGYRSLFTLHEKNVTATAGVDLARVSLDHARTLKHTDTVYSFGPDDQLTAIDHYYLILQPADFNSRFKDHAYNASGYIDLSLTLFDWLTLNPGIRFDHTGFAKQNTFSPRISGSIAIDTRQSINFATGIYYEDP